MTELKAPLKRVAAVNDLSGVGRCALTVAIPVMSAMGIQVCPAVTGVLSAHTGFKDIVARDMTEFLESEFAAWDRMGLKFDAIYSGYLASPRQARIIKSFFDAHDEAFIFVDPAMADDGKLYNGVKDETVDAMKELCMISDIATPNLTEYSFITGERYSSEPRAEKDIAKMLEKFPGKRVVIKSIPTFDGYVNAVREENGETAIIPFEMLKRLYPGTGDIFASVLCGSLVNGMSVKQGVKRAADFVRDAMKMSFDVDIDVNHGVQLEAALRLLID